MAAIFSQLGLQYLGFGFGDFFGCSIGSVGLIWLLLWFLLQYMGSVGPM